MRSRGIERHARVAVPGAACACTRSRRRWARDARERAGRAASLASHAPPAPPRPAPVARTCGCRGPGRAEAPAGPRGMRRRSPPSLLSLSRMRARAFGLAAAAPSAGASAPSGPARLSPLSMAVAARTRALGPLRTRPHTHAPIPSPRPRRAAPTRSATRAPVPWRRPSPASPPSRRCISGTSPPRLGPRRRRAWASSAAAPRAVRRPSPPAGRPAPPGSACPPPLSAVRAAPCAHGGPARRGPGRVSRGFSLGGLAGLAGRGRLSRARRACLSPSPWSAWPRHRSCRARLSFGPGRLQSESSAAPSLPHAGPGSYARPGRAHAAAPVLLGLRRPSPAPLVPLSPRYRAIPATPLSRPASCRPPRW